VKFQFFESLSRIEAEKYLQNFLEVEGEAFKVLAAEAAADGLLLDFTLPSLAPLYEWVAKRATVVPKAPDPALPSWIRDTESYAGGLFDLTPETSAAVMRTAYYLGETFRRQFPGLSWGIGDPSTAEQQQPVVGPFQHGIEMSVILVTENLVRRMIKGKGREIAERAVAHWASSVD
jgi:hypothetical protein